MRSARSGSSLMEKISAIGARDEAVVDGELVGEVATLRTLMGSTSPMRSATAMSGSGQLLRVAPVAAQPCYGQVVAHLGQAVVARPADGSERIVVDLAAFHAGDRVVQQLHQRADEPGLGLPPLTQQDDVLTRQNGVLYLRDDGVLVPDDARKKLLVRCDLVDEVAPHLLPHADDAVTAGSQLTQRLCSLGGCHARSCADPVCV